MKKINELNKQGFSKIEMKNSSLIVSTRGRKENVYNE